MPNKMMLSEEQAAMLCWDDGSEELGLSLVETTDQINELKYVYWSCIYKRKDGKFFQQYNSKTGSYWSDYEFEYGTELVEVVQKPKTIYVWSEVK